MDPLVYWLWLSMACTPGTETYSLLRAKFDTPKQIFEADEETLRPILTSCPHDLAALTDKDLTRAVHVHLFCSEKNVGILTFDDYAFPEKLRHIPSPPVLLYYRGVLPDFNSHFFAAVVGTRRLSAYGRKNAFSISRDLGRAGAIIVSGMAIGIDGVALAGGLSSGSPTVAVIGSGIDVCYPMQHRTLARAIVKSGCVFTEYAPGTSPNRYNFPRRNRLISGLSDVTLVIEGRERSGSILTARHAKAQGRPVYALPGNVDSKTSEVSNLLIREGAKACLSADDIVRDFEGTAMTRLDPFRLSEKSPVDMDAVLKEYEVSCVSAGDDIFAPPRKKRDAEKKSSRKKETKSEEKNEITEEQKQDLSAFLSDFDKDTVRIYKKIPADGDVTVETLVDENDDLRRVMKALLKLEMGRFILRLPGDRVKRNM